MRPVILYRRLGQRDEDYREIDAAQTAGFKVIEQRSEVQRNDLVIGRYSVLPFYKELARDIAENEARLINYTDEHNYIADLINWYRDLYDLTPRTWTRLADLPEGPSFVLKGETNSRKDRWDEMMFAAGRREAIEVAMRLQADGLIGTQDLCIREFEPFVTYGKAIGGAPVTNEYRFFCLDSKVLCGGFYWSAHTDLRPNPLASAPLEAWDFVKDEVLPRIGHKARFVVVDVAEHQDGRWRVVELNDGQMSGLSTIEPKSLYEALAEHFRYTPE